MHGINCAGWLGITIAFLSSSGVCFLVLLFTVPLFKKGAEVVMWKLGVICGIVLSILALISFMLACAAYEKENTKAGFSRGVRLFSFVKALPASGKNFNKILKKF